MPELAYVNGKFMPIREATVSIEDRGFQFGDGVYEVVFVYGGKIFELDAHLARLSRSLSGIDLEYDFVAGGGVAAIEEGLRRCEFDDAMVYLQITRGVAPRVHAAPDGLTPTVVMTFKPIPELPAEVRNRGISLQTVTEQRWANCYIKAITLLPNVLAKTRAKRAGFHDAVFVTATGEVRECTSANIMLVEGKAVICPKRDESILHGVTQRFLGVCAEAMGLTMREEVVPLNRLLSAPEVFVTSTAVEVLAVTSIDGGQIGDGVVGPITGGLYEEFRRRARA